MNIFDDPQYGLDVDPNVECAPDFQGVKVTSSRPRIVTLCGSSRFAGVMAVLAWEFEKEGAIALGLHLLPDWYCKHKGWEPDESGGVHHIGELEKVEDLMDALHFKKIEMSEFVYVVNVDGYIGTSTAREIAYAESLGKPVKYFEDPNGVRSYPKSIN